MKSLVLRRIAIGVLAGTASAVFGQVAGTVAGPAAAPPAVPRRLALVDAEALARKNNPLVTVARLNALASREVTVQVKSALFPTLAAYLTAVGSHEGSRIEAGGLSNPIIYDRAAGGVAVNQLITDFGRSTNLLESSKLRARAEDEREIATAAQITLAVDQAFYGALETRAVLRVAQQTVAARKSVAERVRALAESKLKSELDASFAEVNLAEANMLLLDAENAEKASLTALSAVLGYADPQDFEPVEDSLSEEAPPADAEALVQEAMSRRPELMALDLDSKAAERFSVAERDLRLPSVRALGAVGGAPFRAEQLPPWYGVIGVNVEIPVFNGFLFDARAKEADLRAQASRQRLLDLRNAVARDVRTTWLDAQTAYSRLGVARQLFEQARLALSLAQTRYDLGLGSIVELSQAQLQQTRAEIGDAEVRYRYRVAQAALRFQVGRP